MMILTANSHPYTDVWLNGRRVSDWTTQCKVPDKAGRIGWGWADMLVGEQGEHWLSARVGPNGEPLIHRKYGFVKWMPMEQGDGSKTRTA